MCIRDSLQGDPGCIAVLHCRVHGLRHKAARRRLGIFSRLDGRNELPAECEAAPQRRVAALRRDRTGHSPGCRQVCADHPEVLHRGPLDGPEQAGPVPPRAGEPAHGVSVPIIGSGEAVLTVSAQRRPVGVAAEIQVRHLHELLVKMRVHMLQLLRARHREGDCFPVAVEEAARRPGRTTAAERGFKLPADRMGPLESRALGVDVGRDLQQIAFGRGDIIIGGQEDAAVSLCSVHSAERSAAVLLLERKGIILGAGGAGEGDFEAALRQASVRAGACAGRAAQRKAQRLPLRERRHPRQGQQRGRLGYANKPLDHAIPSVSKMTDSIGINLSSGVGDGGKKR